MAGCAEARDRLAAYCDGADGRAEHADVERHLRECPACADEAARLRATLMRVAALPAVDPSPEFWAAFATELECRLAAEPPPAASAWARFRIRLGDLTWLQPVQALGAAAALGVLLTIGLVRSPRLPAERPATDVVAVGESLRVGQYLDVLEQFELLEDLDLLETLPTPAAANGRTQRVA
jgi:anti-sigma factor RsiW